eukprot:CAMPEP_0197927504 /NCGR_PEP_ID=MMETSP1439-20131203/100825_1 /TAXON_ID=66791 /ORGANISM="Gonyaulax spinifera, Strain CCMP409" /LENGTH=30 /DNA_ID= /DNA_START= /DNA_END= /DNA_ORIENTATION=
MTSKQKSEGQPQVVDVVVVVVVDVVEVVVG